MSFLGHQRLRREATFVLQPGRFDQAGFLRLARYDGDQRFFRGLHGLGSGCGSLGPGPGLVRQPGFSLETGLLAQPSLLGHSLGFSRGCGALGLEARFLREPRVLGQPVLRRESLGLSCSQGTLGHESGFLGERDDLDCHGLLEFGVLSSTTATFSARTALSGGMKSSGGIESSGGGASSSCRGSAKSSAGSVGRATC